MGSHRISFWRDQHPSLADYELAEKLSAVDPVDGAIIVRYKSGAGGTYDQFGSCASPDMLLAYFRSENCHETEILYVDERVPQRMIPSEFRVTQHAPEGSYAARLGKRPNR